MDYVETKATMEPERLTLNVISGLPFQRLWNYTIFTYRCQDNIILSRLELSKKINAVKWHRVLSIKFVM